MRIIQDESRPLSGVSVAIGTLVLLGLGYAVLVSMPELMRYFRIRKM